MTIAIGAGPGGWRRVLPAAAAVLLGGCDAEQETGPVVARVGEHALTVSQLDNRVPADDPQLRRTFVDGWVRRQLLYQEAVDEEVDQAPRLQELIEQARRDLVVAAFLDERFDQQEIDITEADVEQHYHLHPDDFRRDEAEMRARQIVVGSRRDADALRQELVRGADFADKARQLPSIDRDTREAGGDLGYFTVDEHPELWEACANVAPGLLCRTAGLEGAYHILRLEDRQEAGTLRDLDEPGIRQEIVATLVRQRHRERVDELVARLRDEHSWSVDESLLSAP